MAAAAAGVATLLTGDGGPIALLAPGLLAIAGGLLLAQATIPTAGPMARLALRRGRVASALAGLQIARLAGPAPADRHRHRGLRAARLRRRRVERRGPQPHHPGRS